MFGLDFTLLRHEYNLLFYVYISCMVYSYSDSSVWCTVIWFRQSKDLYIAERNTLNLPVSDITPVGLKRFWLFTGRCIVVKSVVLFLSVAIMSIMSLMSVRKSDRRTSHCSSRMTESLQETSFISLHGEFKETEEDV